MQAIVTVVGSDKVGIVAGVTATLAELNANIIDISQTILGGAFTMMMAVELPENANFAGFKEKLTAKGQEIGVNIHVQNEAIFKAMSEI
ncbi:MAG: ACT domain-containing protein [Streptococcaceae bacterium]|jgi:ACT domain-containing protein|nr:ACT domain-containing protein [Streptococcaceae bacterium]